MIIKTDRLLLRPLCSGDLKTVHEYAGDIENTKYMLFLPNATEKETEAFLAYVEQEWEKEYPSAFEFAIVLNGVQIGGISISIGETPNQGELGWILNKRYWSLGYVSEAAVAVLDFAKTQLHLKKVIARCDFRNAPSARVMEKIGMRLIDDTGTRTYTKRDETARELTYMIEL